MNKCKNDLTRSYKGTEPSPKGLGWCAHCEKEKEMMVIDGLLKKLKMEVKDG